MPEKDTGLSTLISLSEAEGFNEWMFEAIRPYVRGKILEIGSGIGNISSLFVRHHIPLYLSDHTDEYTGRLRARFASEESIKDIYSIDLVDPDFDAIHSSIAGTFDTVFALNVIEHIGDDHTAVSNCYKLLAPGGRLVLLVPAGPALYNRLDKELEHFRRYTSGTLRKLLSARFDVVEMKHFNLAGILGWWLTGAVLRWGAIGSGQAKIYSRLTPLLRLADRITFHKIGLSLVAVGVKKQGIGATR